MTKDKCSSIRKKKNEFEEYETNLGNVEMNMLFREYYLSYTGESIGKWYAFYMHHQLKSKKGKLKIVLMINIE